MLTGRIAVIINFKSGFWFYLSTVSFVTFFCELHCVNLTSGHAV